MSLSNLAAQDEADTGTARFRRKERYEQVSRIGQPGSLILNHDIDITSRALPKHALTAVGIQRCVDSIANEINQQLFDLIRIRLNCEFRTRIESNGHPCLQANYTMYQGADLDRIEL